MSEPMPDPDPLSDDESQKPAATPDVSTPERLRTWQPNFDDYDEIDL